MRDFWFRNRTKLVLGRGVAEQIGATVADFGSRPLVVSGQGSARASGLLERVEANLVAAGLKLSHHCGVRPNPVLSHVRDGIESAKRSGADCVLAVGGASVIDSAKAIAAGCCTDDDIWHFFSSSEKVTDALPIITLPTLAATGAETDGGVVLMHDKTKEKVGVGSPAFYPRVSLLDPTLMLDVPWSQTAYGLVDACSHCLEPLTNGDESSTPVQDAMGGAVIRSLLAISVGIFRSQLSRNSCNCAASWWV